MKNSENVRCSQKIPDYDYLFVEENSTTKGKKRGRKLLSKVLFANFWKLVLTFFLELIKMAPVWIVPIITAEIIDLALLGYSSDVLKRILILTGILLVLYIQNVPTTMIKSRVSDRLLRKIGGGFRRTVIRKLQHLSISYHKEIETGKIHSKFLKDLDSVDNLMRTLIIALIPSIFSVIISSGISLYRSGIVTLFFIAIVPLNLIVVGFFRNKLRKTYRDFRYENEEISSKLTNMLEMIPLTKAHGLEEYETVGFEKNISDLVHKGIIVDHTNACFGSITWVVSSVLSALCLVFCSILALYGKISPGEIVLYQTLFGQINGNVSAIINLMPTISSGVEALDSISEIMYSTDIESDVGKNKIPVVKGEISFKNVSYTYPNTTNEVISDFSLDVNKGECIAVVGSSGSGKTTLMNMIIGFLLPTKGNIYIDGQDITTIALSDYRHNISVVPQNSILFSGSIRENITYGLNEVSQAQVNKVTEMANLHEFIDDLPNGLDTLIGDRGCKLSGGQKQRITIARALIRDPKILILDEATSALDNISEYHVQKAISSLIKGRTTFIVAHRLSTIRDADRIVVMENGKCVETGTYEELMAKQGKFFELKNLNDLNYKKAEQELS